MPRKKRKRRNQVSTNKRPLKDQRSGSENPADTKSPKTQPAPRSGLAMHNAPQAIDQFELINVNAAGIDIGAAEHYVAVPENRDPDAVGGVRSFGAFTADLEGIADWLTACGITTVAMESTGVYWIPLFELLERRGFDVILVEPSQIKKHRRKTDVLDCQWIQTLHTYGLLSASFRPADAIIVLRSYMRQRELLTRDAARHIQHMQKAMEQMNIKLTEVVSDITGVTGMSIIRAILAGQRDAQQLASLRNDRCKNDEATIALALQGNWRDEHLFALKQAVDLYDILHEKLVEVDEQIEQYMHTFEDKSEGRVPAKKPRRRQRSKTKNEPKFDTRTLLFQMTGTDLTEIEGISEHAALRIVSEIGTDMTRWPSEKHFTSWLCLCPEMNKSGGRRQKKGRSRTQPSGNRAAGVLRVCAQTLFNSKHSQLGAFARRIRSRDGAPSAVTATARKLAIIIYHMLKSGRPYVDHGPEHYEAEYRERQLRHLERRAQKLGYDLTQRPA